MEEKIYLTLLAVCAILCQEIHASLEENVEESSDHHIRVKRLVDNSPEGHQQPLISDVPYVVNILRKNKAHCGGAIIKPWAIITNAHCVARFNMWDLTVLSGTASRHNLTSGTLHRVDFVAVHEGYNFEFENDLSILHILPHIVCGGNSPNNVIPLHYRVAGNRIPANLHPNTHGLITGWGSIEERVVTKCIFFKCPKVVYPESVRSITVPIISLNECRNILGNTRIVTEKNICTFDPNKYIGYGDSGSPLVVGGMLLGIAASATVQADARPDIFMNVADGTYKDWIAQSSDPCAATAA